MNRFKILFVSALLLLGFNVSGQDAGMALQLDGIDDFISAPLNDHDFSNFTLECWINVPTYDGNVHYISFQQNAYLILGDYTSTPKPVSTWADGLSPLDVGTANQALQPDPGINEWHHLAFSYDGVSQKILVDGVVVVDAATTGTVTLDNTLYNVGLVIGARYSGDTQFAEGLIDEVRIWNIAVPDAVINARKNKTLQGIENGLVGYWKFDDDATDSTPFGQDGSLNGGASFVDSNAPVSDPSFIKVTNGALVTSNVSNYGASWGDYNNDGFVDLFVPASNGANALYRNNGDGTFSDALVAGDLGTDANTSLGSAWGDYDNDGDLDLFVANGNAGDNSLYRNNGDETFTRVVAGDLGMDGMTSQNAAWADFDNDGFLDIFVANSGENHLYHNNQDGTFTRDLNFFTTDVDNSWGCAWGDYDGDGDQDLYVTNSGVVNYLYRNDGAGIFTKINTGGPVTDIATNYSATWVDYDNDGDLDLYAPSSFADNLLYENDGSGNFTRILSGDIVTTQGENWSAMWGDYDSDGREDLLLATNGNNSLFKNNGSGNFTIDLSTSISDADGYSLGGAWTDHDNDGDLDLYIANYLGVNEFYINNGYGNNFVGIDLIGTASNADGVGAKVWIEDALGNSRLFEKNTQSGRGQSAGIHAGLGTASVKSINVQWPSGVFQSVKASNNQHIQITEFQVDDDRPQILLVTADQANHVFDVQKKLIECGEFALIQNFAAQDAANATPSLQTLMDFDAVFAWSNNIWDDPVLLGDNLADYIDQGGKVVSAVFALNSTYEISGRFATDYRLMEPGSINSGQASLGAIVNPDHPILNGITNFDGGTSSFRSTGTVIDGNILADWSDGTPFVISKDNVGPAASRRVDLNFWPVSSDAFSSSWVSSTDGAQLMINALLWSMAPPDQFTEIKGGTLNEISSSWAVAWGDYNDDGFDDLFIGNSGAIDFLYQNNGDGSFTKNTTDDVVIQPTTTYGAVWGDYNNDSHLDLFVAGSGTDDLVYRNNGDGTLTEIFSFLDGSASTGGAWGDYNNDGLIDLFVIKQGVNALFVNNGDDTFTDTTPSEITGDIADSWTAAWGDYDDDGFLDIYIANFGPANTLLHNNGDGTFSKVTSGAIVTDVGSSVGATWGDYNNDGYIDLYVSNWSNENNALYRNNSGDGTFTKIENQNIVTDGSVSSSSSWVDYNNDGFQDLFVATGSSGENDLLYENNGDGTFTQIFSWAPTIQNQLTYGSAWADYDRDGDVDLVVADFGGAENLHFINNGSSNNWITITLEGTLSNASGIGAKVFVTDDTGNTQLKVVETLSGFGVQNSLSLEFGLGSATSVDNILIKWPSGVDQHVFDTAVNQFITITEDGASPVVDSENFPPYYDKNGGQQLASITASDDQGINYVELHYVGISEPLDNTRIIPAETTDGITFTFDLAAIDNIDEPLGVGYLFRIVDLAGNITNSNVGVTHIEYLGNNTPTIPNLKFGTNETDYQIISIPLELNSDDLASVFGDDLGALDNTKWRMFRYSNGNTNELSDGSSINPDEGYWLISKNSATIDVGEGSVPQATKGNPSQLSLSSGWNQIGNPYNFTLSWQEILDFNGNPTTVDTELTVYNSGFSSSDLLGRFKGAFVFSTANVNLDIPVIRNKSIQSGRKGEEEKNSIDEKNWSVDFVLRSGDFSNWLGGIGMNEASKISKDRFDRLTVPRFIKYLDLSFDSLLYKDNKFTKSVVPPADNQVWSFTVGSNIDEKEIRVEWDNSYWGNSDKQLVLFDKVTRKSVDMRLTNNYVFSYYRERGFDILYGNPDFIQEKLTPTAIEIGNAHPNPFNENSHIPFSIPDDDVYNVNFTIYNQLGSLVKEFSMKVEEGYHELIWNGTDNQGVKLPSGIYLGRMDVIGSAGKNTRLTQRLVLE